MSAGDRRAPGPDRLGRRKSDRKWPRFLRDFWLVLVTGVVMLSLQSSSTSSERAKIAAQHADQLAAQVAAQAREIQRQRYDTILGGCNSQNARHDGTIRALGQVYRQRGRARPLRVRGVPPTLLAALLRVQEVQAQASRAPTKFLINALQPHQDCKALVAAALGAHPRPPALWPILPRGG